MANSSVTMQKVSSLAPTPPYSWGTESPSQPCRAKISRRSHGYWSVSSISAARGITFSLAICRTFCCIVLCSSVSCTSLPPGFAKGTSALLLAKLPVDDQRPPFPVACSPQPNTQASGPCPSSLDPGWHLIKRLPSSFASATRSHIGVILTLNSRLTHQQTLQVFATTYFLGASKHNIILASRLLTGYGTHIGSSLIESCISSALLISP